ncbi:MAG: hypothetical protein NXI01_08210 [Gammaproteobacteria bacterium]|nr:hypothetical protein [Gammaproteobacteria bacterium]
MSKNKASQKRHGEPSTAAPARDLTDAYQTFVQASEQFAVHHTELLTISEKKKALKTQQDADKDVFDRTLNWVQDSFEYLTETQRQSHDESTTYDPTANASGHNELALLFQLRNDAFFKYLDILRQNHVPQAVPSDAQLFHRQNKELIATTNFIQAFRDYEVQQLATIAEIETNIANALQTPLEPRKPWIEQFIPAFILYYFNYQAGYTPLINPSISDEVCALSGQYQDAVKNLKREKSTFQEGWYKIYGETVPEGLNLTTTELKKRVIDYEDPKFTGLCNQYLTVTNTMNLVNLYRYAYQIQATHTDDLERVTELLKSLHPDMKDVLAWEEKLVDKEQRLADFIKKQWFLKHHSEGTNFLFILSTKYQTFLRHKTWENFADMYEHFMQAKASHHNPNVQTIGEGLALFYSQAVKLIQQTHLPNISPKNRATLLKKHNCFPYRGGLYETALRCIYVPSLENFEQLEKELRDDRSYTFCKKTPEVQSIVHNVMALCIAPEISISEKQSHAVDDKKHADEPDDGIDFRSVASAVPDTDDVAEITPISYAKDYRYQPINSDDFNRQQFESYEAIQQLAHKVTEADSQEERHQYFQAQMIALSDHLNAIELKHYQSFHVQTTQEKVTDYCHYKLPVVTDTETDPLLQSSFHVLTHHFLKKHEIETALSNVQEKIEALDNDKPETPLAETRKIRFMLQMIQLFISNLGIKIAALFVDMTNAKHRKNLVESRNELSNRLYECDKNFEVQALMIRGGNTTITLEATHKDLEHRWYDLSRQIKDYAHPELKIYFEDFVANRSTENFLRLYQQLTVQRHFNPDSELLDTIDISLQRLYPAWRNQSQAVADVIQNELRANDNLYRLSQHITAISSPARSMLNRMLVSFLNDKSIFNLKVLHQKVSTLCDPEIDVYCKQIAANLKTLYPEELATIEAQQQARITHIQGSICSDLLLLQHQHKSKLPEFPALRIFASDPSTEHALAVLDYLYHHPDDGSNVHYTDIIQKFIEMCVVAIQKPAMKPQSVTEHIHGFFQKQRPVDQALVPVTQALLGTVDILSMQTMEPNISNTQKWETIAQIRDLMHTYIKVIVKHDPTAITADNLAYIKQMMAFMAIMASPIHNKAIPAAAISKMQRDLDALDNRQPLRVMGKLIIEIAQLTDEYLAVNTQPAQKELGVLLNLSLHDSSSSETDELDVEDSDAKDIWHPIEHMRALIINYVEKIKANPSASNQAERNLLEPLIQQVNRFCQDIQDPDAMTVPIQDTVQQLQENASQLTDHPVKQAIDIILEKLLITPEYMKAYYTSSVEHEMKP